MTGPDSSPLLQALTHKGYPAWAPPLPAHRIGQQGWHIHQPDWPLPCATLRQPALTHNIGWLQRLVRAAGAELAPHGKTTLSPELMQAQLDAGAWGITFASVAQLAFGAAHGIRRAVIANQVLLPHDLAWLQRLLGAGTGLQAPFLIDSHAQLDAIESFQRQAGQGAANTVPWQRLDVLVELGLPGGRTGCRDTQTALTLAERAATSAAVRLAGVECYEGLWAQGDDATDTALVSDLMQRVHALVQSCDARGWFAEVPEILVTAGGSAVYDLVLAHFTPQPPCTLSRPLRAVLRSGCYVTHDHGAYQRFGIGVQRRLAALAPHHPLAQVPCASGLQGALEVWCAVQALPEPGLAILNAGKRDLSHDWGLPVPLAVVAGGQPPAVGIPGTRISLPADWQITKLNDQHAYLSMPVATGAPSTSAPTLSVGDRVALGISHPCTTFDRWRWMPVVDDQGRVVDAITTGF